MAADPLRGAAPRVRQHARLSDADLVERVRGSGPQIPADERLLECGKCSRTLTHIAGGFLACATCAPCCSCRQILVVHRTMLSLWCVSCRRLAQHYPQPRRITDG